MTVSPPRFFWATLIEEEGRTVLGRHEGPAKANTPLTNLPQALKEIITRLQPPIVCSGEQTQKGTLQLWPEATPKSGSLKT